MAYGDSTPPPPPSTQGRGPNGDKIFQLGDVSFVDESPIEEDPPEEDSVSVPPGDEDPTELLMGAIKFEKIIYSKKAFTQRVDTSISEFIPQRTEVDLSGFFDQYYQLFFDIPQDGILSHTTLIKESMDYVNDFTDYKDDQIRDLESQVETLLIELNTLKASGESAEAEGEGDIFDEIDQRERLLSLIGGNIDDPIIYWKDSVTLQDFGIDHLGDGSTSRSELAFNGAPPSNAFENSNMNGPRKDLKQAYEKESDGKNGRKYSQWKSDIDDRSSNKDQRDLFRILDWMKDQIRSAYDNIGG
jgi:hypothetical protein